MLFIQFKQVIIAGVPITARNTKEAVSVIVTVVRIHYSYHSEKIIWSVISHFFEFVKHKLFLFPIFKYAYKVFAHFSAPCGVIRYQLVRDAAVYHFKC